MPISPTSNDSSNIIKPNKSLTLDDLATMFSKISINENKWFKPINSRIDDIRSHLSILDSTLDECNKKFECLEDKVLALEIQNKSSITLRQNLFLW